MSAPTDPKDDGEMIIVQAGTAFSKTIGLKMTAHSSLPFDFHLEAFPDVELRSLSHQMFLDNQERMVSAIMGIPQSLVPFYEPSSADLTRQLLRDVDLVIEPYRECMKSIFTHQWSQFVLKNSPVGVTMTCDYGEYETHRCQPRLFTKAQRASANCTRAIRAGNRRRAAYWGNVEARAWAKCRITKL